MDCQIRLPRTNKEFILGAIESGLRSDGRSVFDYRHLSITFGRDNGCCEVQLGNSKVFACVSVNLVAPYQDKPNQGKLCVQAEFSQESDPAFEPGLREEFMLEIANIINQGLRKGGALDMEALCVVPGKFVWEICLAIHILNDQGNLIDASNMAAVAALSVFRRNDCTIGDNGLILKHDPKVRDPIPLEFHFLPLAMTFACSGDGKSMILDPTLEEEIFMEGRMTITVNKDGEVCGIHKPGGAGLTTASIMDCLRVARTKAPEIALKIGYAVESYNREKALEKVMRA